MKNKDERWVNVERRQGTDLVSGFVIPLLTPCCTTTVCILDLSKTLMYDFLYKRKERKQKESRKMLLKRTSNIKTIKMYYQLTNNCIMK